ncbi:MAG: GNAT family N-acetyltransferase [Pseudomonadota bacterium]|nr:GNAT family N-acetyltransferase [Pseudomonadota bacterium]
MLAGSANWSLAAAETLLGDLPPQETVWLSDRGAAPHRLPLGGGNKLLGREVGCLVYDAHSGFDPNSFGAALGALRGGGLLLLLTPPIDRWPQIRDPQAARVAVHPFSADQVKGRYLRRFARVLTAARGVVVMRQAGPIPALDLSLRAPLPPVPRSAGDCRTPDQEQAVEAVIKTARGRAYRPLVLTSDRGRGKSSALGIAAARLLADTERHILVTATRRASVEPLFHHAARLLPDAEVHRNRIEHGAATLEFLPPDRLSQAPPAADLLLVDEAAGIPAPLLERLLSRYSRVVFATTVHGYEGTGRGFEVRFRRTLDRQTPGWRELRLHAPIRWAADDPLEACAARALLLDAAPVADTEVAGARVETCRFEHLDRDTLAEDEPILSQLFGLLVLAHYQTRPMDLRHLLDGPNVRIYALKHAGQVAAAALVAIEGGFDSELARDIFEGRRRPRGHLLPQTLSTHAGIEEAPELRYARIVRIVVHPAVQDRGLGRRLLDGILEDVRTQGMDLAGASFGATAELLRFWERCGFPPAHLGTSRNAASGAHAAVVLCPLTPAGESLRTLAVERLGERLTTLLGGPLRDLEPELAACLIRNSSTKAPEPDAREWRELHAFAFALRPWEAALPPIFKLTAARLGEALRTGLLTQIQRDLLIAKVLQHRDWGETAALVRTSGRAEVIARLREAVGALLGRFAPNAQPSDSRRRM